MLVPATANYSFAVASIQIEGDDAHGVDVQFPWEAHPQREHSHTMALASFHIDKFPATNAKSKFLGLSSAEVDLMVRARPRREGRGDAGDGGGGCV